MRTEIPVLRSSLVAWGYFKLMLDLLVLLYAIVPPLISTATYIYKMDMPRDDYVVSLVILSIIGIVVAADAVLHVMFIVGAHKKNVQLLRVYFYYSLTILLLEYLFGILYIGVVNSQWGDIRNVYVFVMTSDVTIFLGNLVVHSYVLLLVRSELAKLKDSSNFSSTNDAAEVQHILSVKDPNVDNIDTNSKDKNNTVIYTKVRGFDTLNYFLV